MWCFLGMYGEVPPWECKTLAQQLNYQAQRRWKTWLGKAVLPRICPLQCINALPAFLLAISSFLLVDTLWEFMGAGVVLNFIKLIRITLKRSLSRPRQTVLRANIIAVISPSCCLLPFRPMFSQQWPVPTYYTQLLFWLSRYFQNNFLDSTARSGWHGSKNVEYNFLMAKERFLFL